MEKNKNPVVRVSRKQRNELRELVDGRSNAIGEAIKRERRKAGLTQTDLAERLDVTRSLIGQYERGLRSPKPRTVQRIADALGVHFTALAPVSDDQSPEEKAAAVSSFTNEIVKESVKSGRIEFGIGSDGALLIRAPGHITIDQLVEAFNGDYQNVHFNAFPALVMAIYKTGNMKTLVRALYDTGTFVPMKNEIDALADSNEAKEKA